MEEQPERTINVFPMSHIAGESPCPLRITHTRACRLDSCRIPRKQHDAGAAAGKNPGKRFTDAH
jgi:hypothetical protein